MFIGTTTNPITRAPEERNVSGNGTWAPTHVSLRRSEENLLEAALSINISPLVGEAQTMFCCTSKLNPCNSRELSVDKNLPTRKLPFGVSYRSDLNEARSSETKDSGCSHAAKCVPLGSRL